MLDVDDMVMVKVPDAKSIMTFLVTIYQHFNTWTWRKQRALGQLRVCYSLTFCFNIWNYFMYTFIFGLF